jgi:hypothetical protein
MSESDSLEFVIPAIFDSLDRLNQEQDLDYPTILHGLANSELLVARQAFTPDKLRDYLSFRIISLQRVLENISEYRMLQ